MIPEPIAEPIPDRHSKLNLDQVMACGYGLLLISLTMFVATDWLLPKDNDQVFALFFLHYFIAFFYFVVLIYKKSFGIIRSWKKEHIDKTILLGNLCLISAYALNRELPVFEESTTWLCVYLVLTSLVTLSYRYFSALPDAINRIQHVILGSSIVLYFYMSLFVAPLYPVGAIGILLIGVGGHIFVPVVLFIGVMALVVHSHEIKKVSSYWIVGGALATLLYCVSFMYEWNTRIKLIERMANQSVISTDTELPVWVNVGQSLHNDWITQRILKSDLVYTVAQDNMDIDFFPRMGNFEEARKHDPLVFLASIYRKCALKAEERIKILQAITDVRHRTQERLWSGDNLQTSYIVSDVDIYTDLRLSYTEKYLTIRNTSKNNRWWGNTEEAIYTFELPEGSVVTSLSLWVNGKEEKAILTSKQKATEAYTTIVGVEQRDPSVVHWQEGNTVSVRVFPCTRDEERKFKIGITSPLAERDNEIIYNNVTFRGPNATGATETSRIRFVGTTVSSDLGDSFKKNNKGEFLSEHTYDPDFSIAFPAVPLKPNQFTFEGSTYSLKPFTPDFKTVQFKTIYLDINNSWSSSDLRSIKDLLASTRIFAVSENEFVLLNEENWNEVTARLMDHNYSLFPFHRLKGLEHSLVITKGKILSPHLSDFKESTFAKEVSNFFASRKKVYLYALSGEASTYIKSLKELRAFNFAHGDTEQLSKWIQDGKFPTAGESDQSVVLHDAKMVITRSNLTGNADNAPDHLLRLFAYNQIMGRVGVDYFKDDFINEALVDIASTAYVVSPVSSLIVLETKEDYERFGIKDKENSLHNASKNSAGAVPEPHEWALIILFLVLIAYTLIKRYRFQFLK